MLQVGQPGPRVVVGVLEHDRAEPKKPIDLRRRGRLVGPATTIGEGPLEFNHGAS